MIDARALHRRATERVGELVQAIREDQWGLPTPCTDWDVRALLQHLVYEQRWVVPLLAGATIQEVGDRFEGDLLGSDPKGAWASAASAAVAAFSAPDALERTVHLSYGDVPGEHYAFELGSDLLVHGWDLARGIGADGRLDPELAAFCYERWLPRAGTLRASGLFGPEVPVPADADPGTKLLGLMGRRA